MPRITVDLSTPLALSASAEMLNSPVEQETTGNPANPSLPPVHGSSEISSNIEHLADFSDFSSNSDEKIESFGAFDVDGCFSNPPQVVDLSDPMRLSSDDQEVLADMLMSSSYRGRLFSLPGEVFEFCDRHNVVRAVNLTHAICEYEKSNPHPNEINLTRWAIVGDELTSTKGQGVNAEGLYEVLGWIKVVQQQVSTPEVKDDEEASLEVEFQDRIIIRSCNSSRLPKLIKFTSGNAKIEFLTNGAQLARKYDARIKEPRTWRDSSGERGMIVQPRYGEYNLKQFLKSCSSVSYRDTFYLSKALASELKRIHDLNIVHRDFKEENVVLGWHDDLKIVDFDYAISLGTQNEKPQTSLPGTELYVPLDYLFHKRLSKSVDVYALGVVLANILRLQHKKLIYDDAYPQIGEKPLDAQRCIEYRTKKELIALLKAMTNIIPKNANKKTREALKVNIKVYFILRNVLSARMSQGSSGTVFLTVKDISWIEELKSHNVVFLSEDEEKRLFTERCSIEFSDSKELLLRNKYYKVKNFLHNVYTNPAHDSPERPSVHDVFEKLSSIESAFNEQKTRLYYETTIQEIAQIRKQLVGLICSLEHAPDTLDFLLNQLNGCENVSNGAYALNLEQAQQHLTILAFYSQQESKFYAGPYKELKELRALLIEEYKDATGSLQGQGYFQAARITAQNQARQFIRKEVSGIDKMLTIFHPTLRRIKDIVARISGDSEINSLFQQAFHASTDPKVQRFGQEYLGFACLTTKRQGAQASGVSTASPEHKNLRPQEGVLQRLSATVFPAFFHSHQPPAASVPDKNKCVFRPLAFHK